MNAFILNGGIWTWLKIWTCVAIMIWAGYAIREQGRREGAVVCSNAHMSEALTVGPACGSGHSENVCDTVTK